MKLEEFNAGISHHRQDEAGFVFHNFLVTFDSTFYQSNTIKVKNIF